MRARAAVGPAVGVRASDLVARRPESPKGRNGILIETTDGEVASPISTVIRIRHRPLGRLRYSGSGLVLGGNAGEGASAGAGPVGAAGRVARSVDGAGRRAETTGDGAERAA